MPKPTTLRNLVGLPDTPPPLADSALVLIDCQNRLLAKSPTP